MITFKTENGNIPVVTTVLLGTVPLGKFVALVPGYPAGSKLNENEFRRATSAFVKGLVINRSQDTITVLRFSKQLGDDTISSSFQHNFPVVVYEDNIELALKFYNL